MSGPIKLTSEQQILVDAIASRMQEQMTHSCAFAESERKSLHEFIDASGDEGANRETYIIVLRLGNGLRDAMKRIVQWVVWVIIITLAGVLFALVGRPGILKLGGS